MKICVFTLGCKVNFYESEAIINDLKQNGYEVTNKLEFADVYILNTCCVTNEGERKSRQLISRCKNQNENAKIIVCGCASQKNPKQFEEKNVSVVVGNGYKNEIIKLINQENYRQLKPLPKEYIEDNNSSPQRIRAYLKVQEGCDNFCSYCIIPFVRGRSRSRNLDSVLLEAKNLEKECKEIVLTGINLSDYKPSLIELIEKLKDIKCRIRIGSLEVNVINEDFLKRLTKVDNFCPQFHLSLQSGCDKTLKNMNRHYTREEYLDKVNLIKKFFPYASITTDLIVGFPLETEEDFMESLDLCKKVGFFMMHCFPYSKREGTKASKMPQVLNSIKHDRLKKAQILSKQLATNYINFLKEKEVLQKLLIEEIVEINGQEYFVGHSEYFVKCYLLKNAKVNINDIVEVKIVKEFEDGVIVE